jgi:hypothetical protein
LAHGPDRGDRGSGDSGLVLGSIALWIAICVVLLSTTVDPSGVWTNVQGLRLIQLERLVRTGFRDSSIPYPASTLDPEGRFSPLPRMLTWQYQGRAYAMYSFAYALLSAPLYSLLDRTGLFVLPILATAWTLWTSTRIARSMLPPGRAWLAAPGVALTTPVWFYALVDWEHALTAALTTAAAWHVLRGLRSDRRSSVLAGCALGGVAYAFRPEAIWFGPALVLGTLFAAPRNARLVGASVGGVALGLVPVLALQRAWFGAWLGPTVAVVYGTSSLPTLRDLWAVRLDVVRTLLLDDGVRAWLWIAGAVILLERWKRLSPRDPWILIALSAAALYGFLTTRPLDLHRDLLSAAPFVLLALLYRGKEPSELPTGRFLSIVAIAYTAGVVLTSPFVGDATWGPRYLLPVYPLLVPLALGFAGSVAAYAVRSARVVGTVAVAFLVPLSTATQLRGIGVLGRAGRDHLALARSVEARGTGVVVVDNGYTAALLGPLYLDRQVLLAPTREDLAAILERLRSSAVERFVYVAGMPWREDSSLFAENRWTANPVGTDPSGLWLLECSSVP